MCGTPRCLRDGLRRRALRLIVISDQQRKDHKVSESNGRSMTTHQYNKVTFNASVLLPSVPEGEWEVTILNGKTRVSPTKNGDPMITFVARLDTAENEDNEHCQGEQLFFRIMFPDQADPSKSRFVNMQKRKLRDLANSLGISLDLIPDTIENPESDFRPFIEAVEGKSGTAWTRHSKNKQTGETDVELEFAAPRKR